MSIVFRCANCDNEIDADVGRGAVFVSACSTCMQSELEHGQESRNDGIASLQNDLQNMVEQNRILQEELDNTIADMHTEGT